MVLASRSTIETAGWVKGIDKLAFLVPGRIIGSVDGERIIGDTHSLGNLKIAQRGSFATWREEVASKAKGSVRLQLALSTALASCLMRFAPTISATIVHLFGESSTGKSTALIAAGSVWGGADHDSLGFGHSWNATPNSLVTNAMAHSGTLLCLDELRTRRTPSRTHTRWPVVRNVDGSTRRQTSGARASSDALCRPLARSRSMKRTHSAIASHKHMLARKSGCLLFLPTLGLILGCSRTFTA